MHFRARSSFVRSLAPGSALLLLGLVGSGCSGTSDGGTGDPIHKPTPSELGSGERVSDVVGEATWLDPKNMNSDNCAIPADTGVNLTGQVIVAVDTYDETNAGQTGNIYVEDVPEPGAAAVPYSGLTVFSPAFTPPDLRVFEGDVLDTFGTISEFPGPSTFIFGGCKTLPEATGTLSFRFENGYHEPVTIVSAGTDPARFDPIKSYAQSRQWIGMLVRIEGVSIVNAPYCSGCPNNDCAQCPADWQDRMTVDIDVGGGIGADDVVTISNELFDLRKEGPPIVAPKQFKSVTGVFTYFKTFHIAPRSAADFE